MITHTNGGRVPHGGDQQEQVSVTQERRNHLRQEPGPRDVSRALDKAGFAIIAAGLEQCISAGEEGKPDRAQMEKLFLSLS